MINGMYLSTMGALTNMARHGIIANNLANSNTVGFKAENATFRELLTESELLPNRRPEINELMEKIGGGVWLNSTDTIFEPGAVRNTGNPLNVAIKDRNGFFRIERDGQEFLSRNGQFTLNAQGEMITNDGTGFVLDEGGNHIIIDSPAYVSEDGGIYTEGTQQLIAQLGLSQVDDMNKLKKLGENSYGLHEATVTGSDVRVEGGAVESSAVEPVNEMTAMIEATRAYEANMKFIQIQDDTLGRTVSTVGSVR